MRKQNLKAAVIGLGVGTQHAMTLIKHPQVSLRAVVEHDVDRASSFVSEYPNEAIEHCSFEDVIKNKDIDLLSIASFDEDHFHQVMSGLENNKHIFVEKPLCQTHAELKQIHALWQRTNCALASNLVLRKAPLYVWLKNLIQSGAMGEIYAFDGDYLYGRMHKIMTGWRSETENYSVMEGGGIHIIDLMLMLTGQKPSQVQSFSNKIATKDTSFRYHDFQSSHFKFDSGLVGRITANFGCVHRHHHIIRVFGTKATFVYDDMGPRIHWNGNESGVADVITENPLPVEKGILIPDFIEFIMKSDIRDQAHKEFDLMAAVLAADDALRNETPTTIEYLS